MAISEKPSRRALRRHHLVRVLKKARRAAAQQSFSEDPEVLDERARRIRDHRSACSCQMCRNPRRSSLNKGKDKLSVQEKRFLRTPPSAGDNDEDIRSCQA